MGTSGRSIYAIQSNIEAFLRRPAVWYWTFTFQSLVSDKAVAEVAFGKFTDLLRRRGAEWVHVWELQKRGAWHVHVLVNCYLDVISLRPWMVQRGWGPQMRVERLHDGPCRERVARYLVKYLTKGAGLQKRIGEGRMSLDDADLLSNETSGEGGAAVPSEQRPVAPQAEDVKKKKLAGFSAGARVANTQFRWCPWTTARPGAMLWWLGQAIFADLFGRPPRWCDIGLCIRLGWEDSDYRNFDPWYEPP